jgi:hypothetical protein
MRGLRAWGILIPGSTAQLLGYQTLQTLFWRSENNEWPEAQLNPEGGADPYARIFPRIECILISPSTMSPSLDFELWHVGDGVAAARKIGRVGIPLEEPVSSVSPLWGDEDKWIALVSKKWDNKKIIGANIHILEASKKRFSKYDQISIDGYFDCFEQSPRESDSLRWLSVIDSTAHLFELSMPDRNAVYKSRKLPPDVLGGGIKASALVGEFVYWVAMEDKRLYSYALDEDEKCAVLSEELVYFAINDSGTSLVAITEDEKVLAISLVDGKAQAVREVTW